MRRVNCPSCCGVAEVLYNNAKVTRRKSCGFRNFRITELALYHALDQLAELALIHEFHWRVNKGIS